MKLTKGSLPTLTFLVLLFLLHIGGCSHKETNESRYKVTEFKESRKYVKNGVSTVFLKGSPYEIGLAHGNLCKDEIITANKSFFDYYDQIPEDTYNRWLQVSKNIQSHIPNEYIEEMRGISDGSGVEYEKILFVNLLSTLSQRKKCFAFSFTDSNSERFTFRQVDISSKSPLYKNMILFIVKPLNGYGFAAILNPGWVDGETGINENGITISQNNIGINQTEWNVMPITHLSRKMLQYSKTIDDAEIILDNQEAYPARLLFMSSKDRASIFEIANKEKSRTDMTNGFLAMANHACSISSKRIRKKSTERLEYANRFYAENEGKMDVNKALRLVRSSKITWLWTPGVQNRQSFFFSPSTLDFWIAIPPDSRFLPASYGPYVGFNLLDELYGKGDDPSPESFPGR